jgi:hypothetical protein
MDGTGEAGKGEGEIAALIVNEAESLPIAGDVGIQFGGFAEVPGSGEEVAELVLGHAEIGIGEGIVGSRLDHLKVEVPRLLPLLFGDGEGPFFGEGGDFGREGDILFDPSELEIAVTRLSWGRGRGR